MFPGESEIDQLYTIQKVGFKVLAFSDKFWTLPWFSTNLKYIIPESHKPATTVVSLNFFELILGFGTSSS